jgi:flagellar basal-body rod protein FlgC
MGLINSLRISASSLAAQRLRMDLIANNVTNMNTTNGPDEAPYQRQTVVFREQTGQASFGDLLGRARGQSTPGGVEVSAIHVDNAAPREVYDPSHPDANADGYVLMPNIDVVTEMTDLAGAGRAYEATVTVLNATKALALNALNIGRGG